MASEYWKKSEVWHPYRPPICHYDYPVRGLTPPKNIFGSFLASFSNPVTIDRNSTRVTHISLSHAHAQIHSKGFTLASLEVSGAKMVIDEPLSLKLSYIGPQAQQAVLLADTTAEVHFDTAATTGGTFRAALAQVTFSLFKRTGAAGARTSQPVVSADLIVDGGVDPGIARGKAVVRLAATALPGGLGLDQLTSADSPCKLEITVTDAIGTVSVAWTYFHVPHFEDIRILEELGPIKAIMLADTMENAVVKGVTAELCTEERLHSLKPDARDISSFNARYADLSKMNDARNVEQAREGVTGIERELRELQEIEKGLGKSGETFDWIKAPLVPVVKDQEQFRNDLGKRQECIKDWIENRQSALNLAKQKLDRCEKSKKDFDLREVPILSTEEVKNDYPNRYNNQNLNIFFPKKKEEEATRYFAHLSWASLLVARKNEAGVFCAQSLYVAGQRDFVKYQDKRYLIRPPTHDPETIGTLDWKRWEFAATDYPLDCAITYAISSCAFGVTFPDSADPDLLIIWHVNNKSTSPIKRVLEILLENEENRLRYTAFRTIVSVFPQVEEVKKYRNAAVYPASVADASETVFLLREANVYHLDETATQAHAAVGVRFPDKGKGQIAGVFGHENAHDYIMDAQTLLWRQSPACLCGKKEHEGMRLQLDYQTGIYGSGVEVARNLNSTAKLVKYGADIEAHAQRGASVPSGLESWTAAQHRFYAMSDIGSGLFGALKGAAKNLADTPCFLLFHSGKREMKETHFVGG